MPELPSLKCIVALLALLYCLTGCEQEKAPEVSGLYFPVVVLHPNSAPVLHADAAELGTMHSNHLLAEGVHELIDASFAFYTLEHLRSTRSGLGQMMNPAGATPVAFELKRQPMSGAAAAREILARRLPAHLDEADAAVRRREMEKAKTLAELLAAFRGKD